MSRLAAAPPVGLCSCRFRPAHDVLGRGPGNRTDTHSLRECHQHNADFPRYLCHLLESATRILAMVVGIDPFMIAAHLVNRPDGVLRPLWEVFLVPNGYRRLLIEIGDSRSDRHTAERAG